MGNPWVPHAKDIDKDIDKDNSLSVFSREEKSENENTDGKTDKIEEERQRTEKLLEGISDIESLIAKKITCRAKDQDFVYNGDVLYPAFTEYGDIEFLKKVITIVNTQAVHYKYRISNFPNYFRGVFKKQINESKKPDAVHKPRSPSRGGRKTPPREITLSASKEAEFKKLHEKHFGNKN
ncbi:MAG: hypothetical protein Kapaf2KO_22740 [Candidatus Kapaibacteriales bacterium]